MSIYKTKRQKTTVIEGRVVNQKDSYELVWKTEKKKQDKAFYEDGYIWFVGRNDDIIKTSGYRVSPFEVESTLQQHPAVLECAVTGVNDRMRNQVVKATIVLSKGFEATKELAADIQKYTKQVAASYKSPRIIEFVSELLTHFACELLYEFYKLCL